MTETSINDPHPSDERTQHTDDPEVEAAVDAGGTRVDGDEVEGPNPA